MVSFICIAYAVVKLKIFKVLVSFQHPWNGPFWDFLSPYSPKYGLILLKFSAKVEIKLRKTMFQKYLKKIKFLQKWDVPDVCSFSLTLTLCFPPEDGQNKKINILTETFSHWVIQICQNQGSISSPLSWEKYDYSLLYLS